MNRFMRLDERVLLGVAQRLQKTTPKKAMQKRQVNNCS